MDDFFSALPVNFNKKKINDQVNPLIVSNPNYMLTVLLESPFTDNEEKDKFIEYLNVVIGYPYQLISVLPYRVAEDEIKAITKTYKNDSINLFTYIKPNDIILTMGRAIYAITKSNDITVDSFTDLVFSDTHFYASEYQAYVFPCFSIEDKLKRNTWEKYFTRKQIERAKMFEPVLKRKSIPNIVIVNDIEQFYAFNKDKPKMTLDIETDGLDFMVNNIGCATMSFDGKTGYFLNWKKILEFGVDNFSDFIKDKFQIYANGKFDLKLLWKHGVKREALHIDYDTYNAGHVLNEIRGNSLKAHAWIYTVHGGYDKELDDYTEKHKLKNYLNIPENVLSRYAAMDAIVTYQVYSAQLNQMNAIDEKYPLANGWSMNKYLFDVVFPSLNMFTDIEYNGMWIDIDALQSESDSLQKQIDEAEDKFLAYVKHTKDTLNIDSGDDIGKLFQKRGLPEIELSKKGIYLSNDDSLQKWIEKGFKEASLLSEYRKLDILQKTFIGRKEDNSGLWQYLRFHPEDNSNRIHSSFAVMLADSGRNKSKNPNLQNNPAHGENAKFVRGHFTVPDKDYCFMSADFSGLQMRLGTILSNDPELTDVFINQSGDVHSKTTVSVILNNMISMEAFLKIKKDDRAYLILTNGKDNKQVLKEAYQKVDFPNYIIYNDFIPSDVRFKSKGFNFGLLFGAKPSTIKTNVIEPNWTMEQCKKYIKDNKLTILKFHDKADVMLTVADDARKKFFSAYKGLETWHKDYRNFAIHNGYIQSIYGCMRRLPELLCIDDDDKGRQANLLNICLNSPIQNMEAVIVMRTMIGLYEFIKENNLKTMIMGQIHDAIELYVHRDEITLIRDKLLELAQFNYTEYKGIPIEIEGNVSDPLKGEVWDFGINWMKF